MNWRQNTIIFGFTCWAKTWCIHFLKIMKSNQRLTIFANEFFTAYNIVKKMYSSNQFLYVYNKNCVLKKFVSAETAAQVGKKCYQSVRTLVVFPFFNAYYTLQA
jgi:hypothetical protein